MQAVTASRIGDWLHQPPSGKGVRRFAARQHLLGVEFPPVRLDTGGSQRNRSDKNQWWNSWRRSIRKNIGLFHLSAIGQATALELSRQGYQVAIHYFENEAGARETFERIQRLGKGRARVYAADLSDPSRSTQLAGDVLEDFGRVDVLVNNAGSLVERRAIADMDFDFWRRVMA